MMAEQRYVALNGKYLHDAQAPLERGDHLQGSEKLWGAAAQAVKAVAASRRWRHSSHRDLRAVISRLRQETGDPEYLALFSIAESLHTNFYENYLVPEDVTYYAEQVNRLTEKLRPLVPNARPERP